MNGINLPLELGSKSPKFKHQYTELLSVGYRQFGELSRHLILDKWVSTLYERQRILKWASVLVKHMLPDSDKGKNICAGEYYVCLMCS